MKLFRIVFTTSKGRGVLFPGPLTHSEACACKASLTSYPWRTVALEPL